MKFSNYQGDLLTMSLLFLLACIVMGTTCAVLIITSDDLTYLYFVIPLLPAMPRVIVFLVYFLKYRTEITETEIIQTNSGKVMRKLALCDVTEIFVVKVWNKIRIIVDDGSFRETFRDGKPVCYIKDGRKKLYPSCFCRMPSVRFCTFEHKLKRLLYLQDLLTKNGNTVQITMLYDLGVSRR